MIEDLVDYLQTSGIGTVGTDIFVGELPLDKTDCIALMVSPSPDSDKSIPYFKQTIDVWSRFGTYEDGYNKLQEVFDLIHRAENYEFGEFHVYISYAAGNIVDNGRDAERRHLMQLTLGFVYRDTDSIS
jgi:hypothetical protein